MADISKIVVYRKQLESSLHSRKKGSLRLANIEEELIEVNSDGAVMSMSHVPKNEYIYGQFDFVWPMAIHIFEASVKRIFYEIKPFFASFITYSAHFM